MKELLLSSSHAVVHTGAGISTAAGMCKIFVLFFIATLHYDDL